MSESSTPRKAGLGRDHLLTALVGILIGSIGGYYLGQKQGGGPASTSTASTAKPVAANPDSRPVDPAARGQIDQLEKLHAESPSDVEVATRLGHAYYDTAQWDRARAMYEEVLPKKGNDPNLITDLGVCYRNLGDTARALGLFERAANLDPKHWQSRYNQAVVYSFDHKNIEKARAILADLKKVPEAAAAATQLEAAIEAHSGVGAGAKKPGE
jgi:tetratricopeptide (TPR) repeat protein